MNKNMPYIIIVVMVIINMLLFFFLYRQNENLKASYDIINVFRKTDSENLYLKNVIAGFYTKEGTAKTDITGLENGKADRTLSEVIAGYDHNYILILEARIGDCSICVDSILHVLGGISLKDKLIFVSTFKNYGTISHIKKENNLEDAVFFNTIQETREHGENPELYLIDKNMNTSFHCIVDYKNMDMARVYLRFIEKRFFSL